MKKVPLKYRTKYTDYNPYLEHNMYAEARYPYENEEPTKLNFSIVIIGTIMFVIVFIYSMVGF